MDNKVLDLLNNQVNKEMFSAYFYLDISNYYADQGLNGFANWFYIQAQEEMSHAMLFNTYILNNGKAVKLTQIDNPSQEYKDFLQPLTQTLEHEKYVTALINTIYAAAFEIKDYRTMEFLNWFIKEQGEEEKNADDLIKKYELFGADKRALYMLDNELAARVFTPPTLTLD